MNGGLRLKFSVLLLFFLSVQRLEAQTTYYVDEAQGWDGAPGTDPAGAWRSVEKVSLKGFLPGDRILFKRGGTWHSPLTISSSGVAGSPVTYGAYGSGPKPLIDVNRTVTDPWIPDGNAYSAVPGGSPSTVFADGVKLHRVAVTDTLQAGQWYYDPLTARMHVRLPGDRDPLFSRIEWPSAGVGLAASGKQYVRIMELSVAAPWDDGPEPPATSTGAGIRIDRSRSVEIIDCTVTGSRDENVVGIHIVNVPDFVVTGCDVSHTLYGIAVVPNPSGFPGLIECCTIHDIDRGPVDEWDGINVGSSEVTDFAGLVIRGNDIARCGEDGIDIFYCRNVIIEQNYIHDSGTVRVSNNQQGIKSVRPGAIIRYNRIENIVSPGLQGFVRNGIIAGGDSSQVYYNLVVHCGTYGILVDSAKGTRVYNNTVLDCPIGIRAQRNALAEIRNNIVDRGAIGGAGTFDIDLDGRLTQVSGGHNLLVRTGAPNVTNSARYSASGIDLHFLDPGFLLPPKAPVTGWSSLGKSLYSAPLPSEPWYVAVNGLAGSRKKTPAELKSDGDWLWMGGALTLCRVKEPDAPVTAYALADFNGGFALRESSHCVDAGTDVGLMRDLTGAAVPHGTAPDIGAFEYHVAAERGPVELSRLIQNYPNPFNPATSITVRVNVESRVRLSVCDVLGREVAVLMEGRRTPGLYTVVWDATGRASGMYIAKVEADGQRPVQSRAMMHLK